MRRARRIGCVLALGAAALSLHATPALATKTHLLLETFGSAAQPKFGLPNGLAVDQSNGDVLVIDSGAETVSRFNPDGTPADFSALGTNVIDAKGPGDGTPQDGFVFDGAPGEQQIAIDNSGTLTDGNIYVTQGHQSAGHVIDVFASSGEYLGQLTGAGGALFGSTGSFPFSPCGVAVDGDGNLFVGAGFENKVYKFDPSANPPLNTDLVATYTHSERVCNLAAGAGPSAGSVFANTFFTQKGNSVLKLSSAALGLQGIVSPGEERLVAVDPSSGHLYAFGGVLNDNSTLEQFRVYEYNASGSGASLISTFFPGSIGGIAVDGDSGRIYVDGSVPGSDIDVYGPLVTIPDVTTGAATITGDTSATLNGVVDPDGVALEECYFEYGLSTAYGQKVPCAESVVEIGTSSKAVHADVSGLDAEALYHFRLVARNANDIVEGKDQTLKTPSKPGIADQWSVDVGLNEATIKAKLNPENSPTTYRFEWGPTTAYGNSTVEIPIGADNTERTVSFLLDHLSPGTTYHYRVVAGNGIGTSEGPDRSFTTFPFRAAPKTDCPNQRYRTGPSANLPDCRAYEMVSPVDKNGGDIKVLVNNRGFPARLDQGSADGNRMTYSAVSAFGNPESAPYVSQYMASRDPVEGWSTEAINAPRESVALITGPYRFDTQYKLFSNDLRDGWLFQDANPPLDSCGPAGFLNLYRRDSATGAYEALIPSAPTNVTPSSDYRLELQGVSEDGSKRVFRANAKLTSDAAGGNEYQLYQHIKGEGCGELRVVSMTTNGKASGENSSAGTPSGPGEYHESTAARAVSSDGSTVFFTLGSVSNSAGVLYLRVNADQEQSPVSAGSCTDSSKACTLKVSNSTAYFWTAASDGSVGVYSVGNELFEYDVEKALAGESASALIAAESQGVVGASEDASVIYFVSSEKIDGEGEAGQPNLYLYQPNLEGSERYRLVATLEAGDLKGFQHLGLSLAHLEPIRNGVRVTPGGRRLAFVSTMSLTGYDNTDAIDGRPSLEVFLYDADADDLVCISCNPSGARPQGRAFGPENELIRSVAAMMPPGETQTFAPRVLSDDGNSLFFESFEALLPRDVNGKADAYQWRRAESQEECDEIGAELYVESSGGCLSLISTGLSPLDTEIADATPDGSTVFIRTAESLLPQDPGQVDVYAARINGGFPQPPTQPAACEGEACQGPLSPPNDPTPASSAFQGAGNVVEAGPSKPRCRKGKVRRKGRCVSRKRRNADRRGKTPARQ